jgi:hypothetical protein
MRAVQMAEVMEMRPQEQSTRCKVSYNFWRHEEVQ